jgi:hypothetical protein
MLEISAAEPGANAGSGLGDHCVSLHFKSRQVQANRSPAPPSDSCDADKARTEQDDGCRLGYLSREFGDDDLAITYSKIGYEDLVRACIERTTAPTQTKRSASTPATTAAEPARAAASTVAATATEPTVPAKKAKTASQIWKRRAPAGTAWIASTSTEKPGTTAATVNPSFTAGTIAAPLTTVDTPSTGAVRASMTASAALEYAGATTATRDDQRVAAKANYEAAHLRRRNLIARRLPRQFAESHPLSD